MRNLCTPSVIGAKRSWRTADAFAESDSVASFTRIARK
jgi:hypothetical protein